MTPGGTHFSGDDPHTSTAEDPVVELHQLGDHRAALVGGSSGAWIEAPRSTLVEVEP